MERVPYWNISLGLLIDFLSLPALAVFGYGIYGHWKRIRQGKANLKLGLTLDALKLGPVYVWSFLTRGIVGTRIYKKLFTGIAHGQRERFRPTEVHVHRSRRRGCCSECSLSDSGARSR